MNNTFLILKQKYLKRFKKKSFIILTILMPFLVAGVYGLVIYFSIKDDTEERKIAVYDESTLFLGQFDDAGATKYYFIPEDKYKELKTNLKGSGYYGLLYIPRDIYSNNQAQLISEKQLPIELAEQMERKLSRFIENDKRQKIIDESGIPDLDEKLAQTRTSVRLSTLKLSESGETKESSSVVAFIARYAMGLII